MLNNSYEIFSSLLFNNTASYPFKIKNCAYKHCKELTQNWKRLDLYIQRDITYFVTWMERFRLKPDVTISKHGWCITFNAVKDDEIMYKDRVAEYFHYQSSKDKISFPKRAFQNFTRKNPIYTTKKDIGFHGTFEVGLNMHFVHIIRNWQLSVILHSPYELPDARHRTIDLSEQDKSKFTIEAQIKVTDDSMLELDINEYE